jgi:holin-like protein
MLESLALLLALQTIGEVLSYALHLPIPGPVIGMVMLLALLAARPTLVARLKGTTTTLLQHLSLLFVPAGVGVMVHWQRLTSEGVAIVVAIVASTVLAIAVTALTVRALLREDAPPSEGTATPPGRP